MMKFLIKMRDKGKNLFDWFVGIRHVITIIILLIIQIALMVLMKFVFGWFDIEKNPESIAIAMYTWGITLITTFLIGMKSMNYLMSCAYKSEHQKEFDNERRHKQELEAFKELYSKMQEKMQILEGVIAEKDTEINTLRQTQQLVATYKRSKELQILMISKSGNIVKEEELYPLKNIKELNKNFPKKSFFLWLNKDIEANDNWRVFYADNQPYIYGVGIILDNVYFAIDLDTSNIYFKGVELSRLEYRRLPTFNKEYDPNANVANHVWIVKRDNNGNYSIINKQQHHDFKEHYRGYQQNKAGNAIQEEIDKLCYFFTKGLHDILHARYGNRIHFVDDNDNIENLNWMTLSEGLRTNRNVQIFMNDLYLTFDAMELCANNNQQLDNALIAQQTNAKSLN